MAVVEVEVNGRRYPIGCEDGQEASVLGLARQFDAQVRELAGEVGQVGDLRLVLMAALLQADELADARARTAEAQAALARLQAERDGLERRAAQALDVAAQRVDALAAKAG
jgi:cell division protein ZapA